MPNPNAPGQQKKADLSKLSAGKSGKWKKRAEEIAAQADSAAASAVAPQQDVETVVAQIAARLDVMMDAAMADTKKLLDSKDLAQMQEGYETMMANLAIWKAKVING